MSEPSISGRLVARLGDAFLGDGLVAGVAASATGQQDVGLLCIWDLDIAVREAVIRSRTESVLRRLPSLAAAARELTAGAKPFGDEFGDVAALCAHVVSLVERILTELRSASTHSASATLRRVAVGNAEFGFAMLGAERSLVHALEIGARLPSRPFAIACRALLLAVGGSRTVAWERIPDLPTLAPRNTTTSRAGDVS